MTTPFLPPPWSYRAILLTTAALLVLAIVLETDTAEANQISPPTNVTVIPLLEGGSLNISWNPEGSNADYFKVYLVLDQAYRIPLAAVPTYESYYIHSGLEAGKPYSYSITSLDDDKVDASQPTDVVTGWPLPPPSDVDSLSPPILSEVSSHSKVRSIIVSGTASQPGSVIEVERVNVALWESINVTVRSSVVTGWFTLVIDLIEDENLVHARVKDPSIGTGKWTHAVYIYLDTEPPNVVVNGTLGPFEVGTPVVLTAQDSDDNFGIQSFEWLCKLKGEYEISSNGPVHSFIPDNEGNYSLTLILIDYAGNQAVSNITICVEKKGIPPSLDGLPGKISTCWGKRYVYEMNDWVEDYNDSIYNLVWYVTGGNSALFTLAIEDSQLTLITNDGKVGEATIHIQVEDPNGRSTQGEIIVSVEADPDREDNGLMWLAIGALVVVVGLPVSYVSLRRFRTKEEDDVDLGQIFFVKSSFLIHNDGRLLFVKHNGDSQLKDPDIISSIFTAIQDFVANAFRMLAPLENIKFGENHLTISRGKNIYLATLSYGPVDQAYLDTARDKIRRIEAEYSGVIENWDGNRAWLNGIEDIIKPLFKNNEDQCLEEVMREIQPKGLSTIASIDFQHGLVVYTVDIINMTDDIIVDPYLDIMWDKEVLNMLRYEPEGSRTEGRFRLDNIRPSDSAKVVLYFDPQVCLESFIRGSMTYMDTIGRLNTTYLDNTLADVNCPIFFTANNANTAMLRKLIEEELTIVDSRKYRYALVLNSKDVYKMAKMAASSYDIQFVMDYYDENPFHGEAWFYGETKVKGYKVVIRVTTSEESNTVEFLAASSKHMVLTGLLAELGQNFLKKMDEKYTRGYNPDRVVKRFVQQDMMTRDDVDGGAAMITSLNEILEIDGRVDELT